MVERRRKIKDLDRPNVGDRVMTVGMVMAIPTVIRKRSFNRAKPTNSPHRTPPKFVYGVM